MTKIFSAGLFAGLGLALCGALLFAWELLRASGTPARVWNVLRWLGLGLPAPEDPRFFGATLAILNAPLWAAAGALGLLLAASFALMRFLNR